MPYMSHSRPLINDKVVYGALMLPIRLIHVFTYEAALEARRLYDTAKRTKDSRTAWEAFVNCRELEIGHNLLVSGRLFATYHRQPARVDDTIEYRCYDGLIIANPNGKIERYHSYAYCALPDQYDLENVIGRLWSYAAMAVNPIDQAVIYDAIALVMRHSTCLGNKVFARMIKQTLGRKR